MMNQVKKQELSTELMYKAVRSSGAGGQHVNKVATKIILLFDVMRSKQLTDVEKQLILIRLKNRINKTGILQLQASSERSQHLNKKKATARFYALLAKALIPEKQRKFKAVSAVQRKKRLAEKRKQSEKKQSRNFMNNLF